MSITLVYIDAFRGYQRPSTYRDYCASYVRSLSTVAHARSVDFVVGLPGKYDCLPTVTDKFRGFCVSYLVTLRAKRSCGPWVLSVLMILPCILSITPTMLQLQVVPCHECRNCSAGESFLERYATGCHLSSCFWLRHAPMARSVESVSILIGNRGSYIFSTGSFKHSCLRSWNDFSSVGPHNHDISFFVRLVSGIASPSSLWWTFDCSLSNPERLVPPWR